MQQRFQVFIEESNGAGVGDLVSTNSAAEVHRVLSEAFNPQDQDELRLYWLRDFESGNVWSGEWCGSTFAAHGSTLPRFKSYLGAVANYAVKL